MISQTHRTEVLGITQGSFHNQDILIIGGLQSINSINTSACGKYTYSIFQNDTIVGTVDLLLNHLKNNFFLEPIGLVNIKISKQFRNQGLASKVISMLCNRTPDQPFKIYDVKKSAIKFWEKLGALKDPNSNRRYDMFFNPLFSVTDI